MVALVTTEWKLEWSSGHKWKWRQQKEPQKHIACRCCVFKYSNSSENSSKMSLSTINRQKLKADFFTQGCFKSYIPGTFRGHFLGGGLLRWVCLPGSGQLKFLPLISRLSHIPNCPTHPPAHLGKPSPSTHPLAIPPLLSHEEDSVSDELNSDQISSLSHAPTCFTTDPPACPHYL